MAMLEKKVAFITGGASGIGKAAAIRFAEEGASVAIADIADQEEEAGGVVSQIERVGKGRAKFLACDVSKPDDVDRAIDETVKTFGGLHVVFANAGINGVWTPVDELQPDEWDKTLDINLKGTYLTVHYAVPHLKRGGGGSVLITSSVNGTRTFANTGASAYSTSKAGQVAFMKMCALELAKFNIRVNAICPGAIHTHIDDNTKKRDIEKVEIKMILPEGKPGIDHGQGEPDEVADVCLF
jgi:NAD(P)-dependent dehydrogenase (short-subunit alcohol dehydrogenase family)